MANKKTTYRFSVEEAGQLVKDIYGIEGTFKELDSDRDQNFLVTLPGSEGAAAQRLVFKIANPNENREALEAQHKAMAHLKENQDEITLASVYPARDGNEITRVENPGNNNVQHLVRMLTFLPGTFFAKLNRPSQQLFDHLGRVLGILAKAFEGFDHPGLYTYIDWDIKNTLDMEKYLEDIRDPGQRRLVGYFLRQIETFALPLFPKLRSGAIHGDLNYDNILVDENGETVTGLIDLGDLVYTYTVFDLGIAVAYAIHGRPDPLETAARIVSNYHRQHPLTEPEVDALFYIICARQCQTLLKAAHKVKLDPGDQYAVVSAKPALDILERFIAVTPGQAHRLFREACAMPELPGEQGLSPAEIKEIRKQHIGRNLSTSYSQPLKIVRGAMQYLFDQKGRAYLDTVNNVCHVGHCHPEVVKAGQRQMAQLNTNTRYLHDNLALYAQRLTQTLPEPLSVCFFVCSGSEANELAIRLARTHTRRKEFIVQEHAYHGNTNAVIDISPYKFEGPGGMGQPGYVHKVMVPDVYRGPYKASDPEAAKKYAADVSRVVRQLQSQNKPPAAFIHESLLSVAGQIIFPDGYLKDAYAYVREAGGVCIADEVQVGFGRVGTHMWAFETQGVVPDIVTMGKPMGNGHPLAAVVTTPEIADSFNNGMEYFNTFGGNPVSCAIGLAVLDVIRDDGLQAHALDVGNYMKSELANVMEKHPLIGDVRGMGLFIGIELVEDRETLAPAAKQALYIADRMKEEGILISIDGPYHNVLKIKPPMVFDRVNALRYVETLDKILCEDIP